MGSDKGFWHGYLDFYEGFFAPRTFRSIAEIGVLRGDSIHWLLERFPDATVFGADILPQQPQWPTNPRFMFSQLDQGNRNQLRAFFSQAEFDLIIEDGSHIPSHQIIALLEGVRALRPGGLYILEDIHTSHPAVYEKSSWYELSRKRGTALSALLAIDHYKRRDKEVDAEDAEQIAHDSLLHPIDVIELASKLKNISLYRRTRLPDRCFNCGSSNYLYSSYKCRCGVDIFSDSDSMSFVLEKN